MDIKLTRLNILETWFFVVVHAKVCIVYSLRPILEMKRRWIALVLPIRNEKWISNDIHVEINETYIYIYTKEIARISQEWKWVNNVKSNLINMFISIFVFRESFQRSL